MICKDEAELHEEYARVIRMCKGTNVKPKESWKFNGNLRNDNPYFSSDPKYYSFALAIVEDRQVFEGDVLYNEHGGKCTVNTSKLSDYSWLSWNPPKKKTFMLNGEELPLPNAGKNTPKFFVSLHHYWGNKEECARVETSFNKLLSGK